MDGYLLWLSNFVCSDEEIAKYSSLLNCLYSYNFSAMMSRDEDRIIDAEQQRRDFLRDYPNIVLNFDNGPTILEVLVALARKLDDLVGYSESCPERWFWYMIRSLGLLSYDNRNFNEVEVLRILERFVERRYQPDGEGGCCYFPSGRDLRDVDIWYQWMWYLNSLDEFQEEM